MPDASRFDLCVRSGPHRIDYSRVVESFFLNLFLGKDTESQLSYPLPDDPLSLEPDIKRLPSLKSMVSTVWDDPGCYGHVLFQISTLMYLDLYGIHDISGPEPDRVHYMPT
jgi:hypothetical protein